MEWWMLLDAQWMANLLLLLCYLTVWVLATAISILCRPFPPLFSDSWVTLYHVTIFLVVHSYKLLSLGHHLVMPCSFRCRRGHPFPLLKHCNLGIKTLLPCLSVYPSLVSSVQATVMNSVTCCLVDGGPWNHSDCSTCLWGQIQIVTLVIHIPKVTKEPSLAAVTESTRVVCAKASQSSFGNDNLRMYKDR